MSKLIRTALWTAPLLATFYAGCGVNHRVYRQDGTAALTKEGVYYWLPETLVLADVRVVSMTRSPARLRNEPGYDNAMKVLFGIEGSDVLKRFKEGETKTSVKDVAFRTLARPDRSQVFYVDIRGAGFEKRDLEILLAQDGLITDGSSKVEDRTIENVVATLKTAAEVASKAIGVAGDSDPKPSTLEEAKSMLRDLCDRRYRLLSFEGVNGAISKDSFERALTGIESEIAKAEALFLGDVSTREVVHTFRIRPKAEQSIQEFKLGVYDPDRAEGLVRASKVEAILETPLTGSVPLKNEVWAILNCENDPPKSQLGNATTSSGFYYRLPGQMCVRVQDGDRVVKADQVAVAQTGCVVRLPGRVNGRLSSLAIGYYPETGAIKKISAAAEPVDLSRTAPISDAASALTKALSERSLGTADIAGNKAANDLLRLQIENIELRRRLAALEGSQ